MGNLPTRRCIESPLYQNEKKRLAGYPNFPRRGNPQPESGLAGEYNSSDASVPQDRNRSRPPDCCGSCVDFAGSGS
ncbi:hypothetical protein SBA5_40004 [Candidatus Sulfotelmatomonas gaucii]|uniref:Uncharacterized protein n=1 Tax=Candidatus Sulfuritelmatomonas gaucii TaxID=2043161 RepID=A0A2N9LJN0_9BACT|nr:hypothetical protein SBA5_40004 [Candidatus Sulfotelmatomonas gaucii]